MATFTIYTHRRSDTNKQVSKIHFLAMCVICVELVVGERRVQACHRVKGSWLRSTRFRQLRVVPAFQKQEKRTKYVQKKSNQT